LRVGKVAGVQLVLNNWFVALIALFAVSGMVGKVLLIFSAVLWHECAHAAAALALGYKVREVELLPFGGVARIDRLGEAGANSEMIMAAAGPAASVVLAAVVYLVKIHGYFGVDLLQFYFEANIMLAAFNLLPALPLDGGRILRAWLSLHWDYGKATLFTITTSKAISAILLGKVIYDYFFVDTLNLSFSIAAVFLYIAARAEGRVAGYRTMRVLAGKKAELSARGFMPTVHYTAMADAAIRDIVRVFGPERYYVVLVVDESYRLCGTLTETEVWEALPSRGLYTKIGELL